MVIFLFLKCFILKEEEEVGLNIKYFIFLNPSMLIYLLTHSVVEGRGMSWLPVAPKGKTSGKSPFQF